MTSLDQRCRLRERSLAVVAISVMACLTALALPAAAGEPVEDRLISSVDGFDAIQEGEGEGAGSINGRDVAAMAGIDPEVVPPGTEMDGYVRLFLSPDGTSRALAGGFVLGRDEIGGFLDGWMSSIDRHGGQRVTLFPDEPAPLGDILAYEVTESGSTVLMAGFGADDLGILLMITGTDARSVLREMMRDQARLTSPTRTRGTDDETDSLAYRLGSVFGYLLIPAVVVVAIIVVRSRRQRREPPPPAPTDDWLDPFERPIVRSRTPATYPAHPPTAPPS